MAAPQEEHAQAGETGRAGQPEEPAMSVPSDRLRAGSGRSIRSATEGDLAAMKALYGQLSSDLTNVDRDLQAILADPRCLCLLVDVEATTVAMVICCVRTSLSSGRKMVIDELVVDRDHRGRGIGRAVIEHCLDLARAQGLDSVELACSLSKSELHAFYESAGFQHRMRLYSRFLSDS